MVVEVCGCVEEEREDGPSNIRGGGIEVWRELVGWKRRCGCYCGSERRWQLVDP